MKRSDFIKGISLASLGAVLPWTGSVKAGANELGAKTTACALIPSETEGPYPLDTASNSTILRQDIRETKTGVQLNVKLKIIDTATCQPITNAWIKIWHCDKDGFYPGYNNNGYTSTQNNIGETFLRGVQITDANGEVEFITNFPGRYSGRVARIYFHIYLSSALTATSQLTFPETDKNAIYASSALYAPHSTNPQTVATNNIFSDCYNLQMTTLTPNATTGGYNADLQLTINGTGINHLARMEPETGGQFKLLQNYPNPYVDKTSIPFALTNTSDVEMEIYDLAGRKVASIKNDNLEAGYHTMALDLQSLGIAAGTYIYQLVVSNERGVFRQCKVMTGAK
jgi:protocatechuate 3,4-dioxygenase beta subunit